MGRAFSGEGDVVVVSEFRMIECMEEVVMGNAYSHVAGTEKGGCECARNGTPRRSPC